MWKVCATKKPGMWKFRQKFEQRKVWADSDAKAERQNKRKSQANLNRWLSSWISLKYVLQNETCVQQIKHRRGQCVLLGLGEMWMVPNYSKDDQAMLPVTGPHMQSRTTSFWKKQTWAARDFFFPLPSDTCDGFHLQKKGLVQRHCKDKAVVNGKKGWTKGNTAGALCWGIGLYVYSTVMTIWSSHATEQCSCWSVFPLDWSVWTIH